MATTQRKCGWAGMVYWIVFILLSALVMLSLFIGAVTMAMTESMEEMKRRVHGKDDQGLLKREAQREKRERKKEGLKKTRESQRGSRWKTQKAHFKKPCKRSA